MLRRIKNRAFIFTIHAALISFTIIVLCPILWIIVASLRQVGNLYSSSIDLSTFSFANYRSVLTRSEFLRWVFNSFVVCSISTILALCFTTIAGYAFPRMRFAGRRYGLMSLIIIQMFPSMMAMVALYSLLDVFDRITGGIIGFNLWGLIVIYTGGGIPFNMWLVKGYMDTIPKELEESAFIDGATRWQAFTKVVLPLMGPILAVIAIFSFIGSYNDFLIPSIVLQDSSQYTLAVGLRSFISGRFSTNWTEFAAASLMGALPIMIVFLSLQRFLVQGLTKGAVKG